MIIIFGPTSSGKTSLALKLCKEHNAEIISADSRQVYKNMDIGTGKMPIGKDISITKAKQHWNLDGINIWGYDLVNPNESYSAYDFAKFALKKAREIYSRNKEPILVGGTGYYIDMVTGKAKLSGIKPDTKLREKLENKSIEELRDKLKALNQKRYESIDKDNPHRLIRAIEIELNKENKNDPLEYLKDETWKYIGLTADREILYQSADNWLDTIWQNGVIEETKVLHEKYKNSDKLKGLVYRSVVFYINGNSTEQEARQQAKYDLHKYIRRQFTWFRQYENAIWLDITKADFYDNVNNLVQSYKQR